MKLSELKPCAVCNGKLVPFWYTVRTKGREWCARTNSIVWRESHVGRSYGPGT